MKRLFYVFLFAATAGAQTMGTMGTMGAGNLYVTNGITARSVVVTNTLDAATSVAAPTGAFTNVWTRDGGNAGTEAVRQMVMESDGTDFTRKVWVSRYFSGSTYKAGIDVAVPTRWSAYAVYTLQTNATTGALGLNAMRIARAANCVSATNTGTITYGGAGWSETANADCWHGYYNRSQTSNDTITASLTGHTLWLRAPCFSNGGYGLVSIDASATAANRLPTVTQDQIDAHKFNDGDLGKAYVETYDAGGLWKDEWFCLAEGLTDAAHTVVITVLGTGRDATSGRRVYISGLAASRWATTLSADPVCLATVRDVINPRSTTAYSAVTPVLSFHESGGAEGWIGSYHGGETMVTEVWSLDGATPTLTADGYEGGTELTLAQTFTMAIGATNVGTKTVEFQWRGDRPAQQTYRNGYHFTTGGHIVGSYAAMQSVREETYGPSGSTIYTTNVFSTTCRVGDTVASITRSGNYLGVRRSPFVAQYSTAHDWVAACWVASPDALRGWGNAVSIRSAVGDTTSYGSKSYISQVDTGGTQITVTAGNSFSFCSGWRLWGVEQASSRLAAGGSSHD
jgi:hypothetical protein